MRNLYLIRHGQVLFADGKKRCIGRTDTPLDEEGRSQAKALAAYFAEHPVEKVYASSLKRARETARLIAAGRYPVEIREDLIELDMGEWEDVPLKELHKELTTEPVQGEGRRAGRERFARCIEQILSETEGDGDGGDVAVVAHAGVLCAYLSGLLGTPLETSRGLPQPYGGFSRILVGKGEKRVVELGRRPEDAPDEARCRQLWERYGTPDPVRAHCRAVCEEALLLGGQLIEAGVPVDIPLLTGGALLHDLMRHKKDHPGEGARCLLKEGYPLVAKIVLRHHDWERRAWTDVQGDMPGWGADPSGQERGREWRPEPSGQESGQGWGPEPSGQVRGQGCAPKPDGQAGVGRAETGEKGTIEAALVYLADKYIQGTEKVTLQQRFEKSRERCAQGADAEQARKAHERRYGEARAIERMVREKIGRRISPL